MTYLKLMAGTNVGLRQNNEDNFTVCTDLSQKDWCVPVDYQNKIELGPKGCVLVVADGMGGQNAGEVASAIAIDTVHEMFAPEVLPQGIVDTDVSIDNYLRRIIVEADTRVKNKAKENPETSGMGSTIVIAWLVAEKAHIAWLGDSRAYCIIKDKGIARLTKDHSYVQELVDAKKIKEEAAMTHPDSNIITRSLGDTSKKPRPDVRTIDLVAGAVILLCSDGLCGVCSDAVIGGIVETNQSDLKICREELIKCALASGGSDNITVAMADICECDNVPETRGVVERKPLALLKYVLAAVLLVLVSAAVFYFIRNYTSDEDAENSSGPETNTEEVVSTPKNGIDGAENTVNPRTPVNPVVHTQSKEGTTNKKLESKNSSANTGSFTLDKSVDSSEVSPIDSRILNNKDNSDVVSEDLSNSDVVSEEQSNSDVDSEEQPIEDGN